MSLKDHSFNLDVSTYQFMSYRCGIFYSLDLLRCPFVFVVLNSYELAICDSSNRPFKTTAINFLAYIC